MARKFLFDPFQQGLRKVLIKHEEMALRYFWDEKAEDASSGDVWLYVNEKLGEGNSISKTTIVVFLQAMANEGVLNPKRVSGKGGYYNLYTQKMNEKDYIKYIIKTLYNSLMRDFTEETKEALKEYVDDS
jgi:predicted transcriptional regulator